MPLFIFQVITDIIFNIKDWIDHRSDCYSICTRTYQNGLLCIISHHISYINKTFWKSYPVSSNASHSLLGQHKILVKILLPIIPLFMYHHKH